MSIQTESRAALRELIETLEEIDQRWAGEEWNLYSEEDVFGAHRNLMHLLEGGIASTFEQNATHPDFRRIVSAHRKFTGDNSDAIYFDAPVDAKYQYRVDGNLQGAVYFSLTVEVGAADGSMASRTAGVINDTELDIDANGNFTLYLGGEPQAKNWLALEADADRVTTRHYFEEPQSAGDNPEKLPCLNIKCLSEVPPPARPSDESVSAGIRRAAQFVRSRTLGMPPMANSEPPPFVGLVPNVFPKPIVPGNFGLAAFDAHYSMAPFFIGDDEALVIKGRWPRCRMANVNLWNRHQQTLDYSNRSVTLNRVQTTLEKDGSFTMIIAHENPNRPNWLDTEGRAFGMVFWRYFLVEGEVETPIAEVVKFVDL